MGSPEVGPLPTGRQAVLTEGGVMELEENSWSNTGLDSANSYLTIRRPNVKLGSNDRAPFLDTTYSTGMGETADCMAIGGSPGWENNLNPNVFKNRLSELRSPVGGTPINRFGALL